LHRRVFEIRSSWDRGVIHRATASSRAGRGGPKLTMIGGGGRKTAPGAPPERIVGVHVPMGPGSSSRASTLASFRLRRFSRPGRVAPLRGCPACFIRSRSWGLGSGGMTQRRVHARRGPKVAPVVLPSSWSPMLPGRGPPWRSCVRPAPGKPGMRHGFVRGETPSEGPALCQTLSRLTRSNATAPDETGVSSRKSRWRHRTGAEAPARGRQPDWTRTRTGGFSAEAEISMTAVEGRPAWHQVSPRDNTQLRCGLTDSTRHRETGDGHRTPSVRWLRGAHDPAMTGVRLVFVQSAW